MLLKVGLRITILVGLIVGVVACHRQQDSEESHSSQLPGTWELQMGDSCEDYPIRSDTLVLHPNGTLEQHTVLRNGQEVDSGGQHWEYSEKDHVVLDKRRDWDMHSDPSILGGKNPTPRDPSGQPEGEDLIVQFGSPPVILINPDSNCMYVKK